MADTRKKQQPEQAHPIAVKVGGWQGRKARHGDSKAPLRIHFQEL